VYLTKWFMNGSCVPFIDEINRPHSFNGILIIFFFLPSFHLPRFPHFSPTSLSRLTSSYSPLIIFPSSVLLCLSRLWKLNQSIVDKSYLFKLDERMNRQPAEVGGGKKSFLIHFLLIFRLQYFYSTCLRLYWMKVKRQAE
jgi:hypothetical protein